MLNEVQPFLEGNRNKNQFKKAPKDLKTMEQFVKLGYFYRVHDHLFSEGDTIEKGVFDLWATHDAMRYVGLTLKFKIMKMENMLMYTIKKKKKN